MRVIKTEGSYPSDMIATRAIMLWPSETDLVQRKQYFAADLLNGCIYEQGCDTTYSFKAHFLQDVLEAPSWDEIKAETAERTKRATAAAYVFMFMFAMDQVKEQLAPRGASGATLKKAIFLTVEWAKTGALHGDGTPWHQSEGAIKKYWSEFRSVAHLWAALHWNQVCRYAPDREIFSPDYFHKFMSAAAYMLKFGANFKLAKKSGSGADVLLPRETTWHINTEDFPPRMMMPRDRSTFAENSFLETLRRYSSSN